MTDRAPTPEEQLLQAALRQADPAPAHVAEFARAVFEWRQIDLALANLVADSTVGDLAGVRGAGGIRFTFHNEGGGTLELGYDAARSVITGSIDPKSSGTCDLMSAAERKTSEVVNGFFEIQDVPSGPVSLVLRLDDGRSFKTEWMTL